MEGVASQDPEHPPEPSFYKTMFLYGKQAIGGTARIEPTRSRQQGGYESPVKLYKKNRENLHSKI
jgi:hypothetical protein